MTGRQNTAQRIKGRGGQCYRSQTSQHSIPQSGPTVWRNNGHLTPPPHPPRQTSPSLPPPTSECVIAVSVTPREGSLMVVQVVVVVVVTTTATTRQEFVADWCKRWATAQSSNDWISGCQNTTQRIKGQWLRAGSTPGRGRLKDRLSVVLSQHLFRLVTVGLASVCTASTKIAAYAEHTFQCFRKLK